jgi:hypothetical protein
MLSYSTVIVSLALNSTIAVLQYLSSTIEGGESWHTSCLIANPMPIIENRHIDTQSKVREGVDFARINP